MTDVENESNSILAGILQFKELPAFKYIPIVSVLVKHLHALSESERADDTHMFQLRKIRTHFGVHFPAEFGKSVAIRWIA